MSDITETAATDGYPRTFSSESDIRQWLALQDCAATGHPDATLGLDPVTVATCNRCGTSWPLGDPTVPTVGA